jgi:hypothetical protein
VEVLIPLLHSEEDVIFGREAAVKALVKIGNPRDVIVPALCDALLTPNDLGNDLFTIVEALKQLDAADRAIETLKSVIVNTNSDDRRERATKALQGLEEDTKL